MSEKIFSKLPQWFNLEEKDHMEKPIEATITGKTTTIVNAKLKIVSGTQLVYFPWLLHVPLTVIKI